MPRYSIFSQTLQQAENLPILGIAVLFDVGRKAANQRLEPAKTQALRHIQKNEEVIRSRMECYLDHFRLFGYECPLPPQLGRTLDQGFPTINRFVDTLLLAEMTTGVLMGAQDYGMMEGTLVFDFASAGESYEGMRSHLVCKEKELVVRDNIGIVASYFQGSDKRTAITRQTANVVFFGFGVDGVSGEDVRMALERAIDILGPAARESQLEMLS